MTGERTNTLFTIDKSVKKALQNEAKQEGRSASRQLETILAERYGLNSNGSVSRPKQKAA